MSTAEVVRAVGGVLEAAAAGGADDGYQRGQTLSALSVCKHLAAEETARRELAGWLEEASGPILAGRREEALDASRSDLAGERLADLMAALRAAADEDSRRALRELRRVLHELCDREIAALATAA
ncbi:MAG TPA: hypothetical protein VIJ21_11860 [Solirubrobacterales bacterium]